MRAMSVLLMTLVARQVARDIVLPIHDVSHLFFSSHGLSTLFCAIALCYHLSVLNVLKSPLAPTTTATCEKARPSAVLSSTLCVYAYISIMLAPALNTLSVV